MARLNGVRLGRLRDGDLEKMHRSLLAERDKAHNHLQNIDRDLDAVRAERMKRTNE